ncbi:MAG: protein kinase domain-containing protein [Phycisphaerae bacterium]
MSTAHHNSAGVDSHSDKSVAVRVRDVLGDVVRRRASGEVLADEALVQAHPDLMPALGHELLLLRMMQAAAQRAAGSSQVSLSHGSMGRSTSRLLPRPDAIPGYEILGEIHRGGQGVVYEARQTSTGRLVAVKLLHRGPLAGATDRARFQREVALLVRLRHPNIVAVHDSGRVDQAHYIVMDRIHGVALDEYVKRNRGEQRWQRESLRATLDLLAKICEALHAAHLRGIIHRDLKPSNILVDDAGQPHVLDFGLAKDIADGVSSVTSDGQFVGSAPWASPEQVTGSADVDVRTDVYSLGVLIFQMLTGTFPYKIVGSLSDVFNTIRTIEPARPGSVRRELDAEIDSIVLRSLAKEPNRRYASAGELARDIRHHLAGEPIEARRDSTLYVLSKHMRRYRRVAVGAVAAVVALVAFAAYAGIQAETQRELARRAEVLALRETQARVAAEDAGTRALAAQQDAARQRDEARQARDAEAVQRQSAERETERARGVTEFLVRTLGGADPDVAEAGGMTLHALLDRAEVQVASSFADQPASEAAVRTVIGRAYAAQGDLEAGLVQLERAVEIHTRVLESRPADQYETLRTYVMTLEDVSDSTWRKHWWTLWRIYPKLFEASVPRLSRALRTMQREMDAKFTADSANRAFLELRAAAEEVLATDDSRWLILADFLYLGSTNVSLKIEPAETTPYLADALAIQRRFLPETNSRVVRTLGALITSKLAGGRFAEAETLASESIDILRRVLPEEHWMIAVTQARRGAALAGLGLPDQAELLMKENLERVVALRREFNVYAQEIRTYLIQHYEQAGQSEQADAYRDEWARCQITGRQWLLHYRLAVPFGPRRQELLTMLEELLAARAAKAKTLQPLLGSVLEARRRMFADEHPMSALVCELLTENLRLHERGGGATEELVAAFDEIADVAAANADWHPMKRGAAAHDVARQSLARGHFARAEEFARRSVDLCDNANPRTVSGSSRSRMVLAEALLGLSRLEEAEAIALVGYRDTLGFWGADAEATAEALRTVLNVYAKTGRPEMVIPHTVAWATPGSGDIDVSLEVLGELKPELAAALRRFRRPANNDDDTQAANLANVLAVRRATLADDDPLVPVYCNAMYRLSDYFVRRIPPAIYIPAFQEIVALESQRLPQRAVRMTHAQWWLAIGLLSVGDAEQAGEVASAGHAARLQSTSFDPQLTRFTELQLAATAARAPTAESAEQLLRSYGVLCAVAGQWHMASSECLGYAMSNLIAIGDAARADALAIETLDALIEADDDGRVMGRHAWKVAMTPGLLTGAYERSLRVAVRATQLDRSIPLPRLAAALAELRLGSLDEAWCRLDEVSAMRRTALTEVAAMRALIQAARGNAAEAERVLSADEAARVQDVPLTLDAVSLIGEARSRIAAAALTPAVD